MNLHVEKCENERPAILMTLRDEISSFNASFPLARALRARGYRIV
jgi:hypothetical protein